MPQGVDLEALVYGGCGESNSKVACETLIGPGGGHKPGNPPLQPVPPDDPDLPAESFRLPVEDVLDWVTRNAVALYDREDSTRGLTNPKPKLHPGSRRHYAAKPKALIIGLPNTIRGSGYLSGSARRQHAANGRFFPRKREGDPSAETGRSTAVQEPTSPKVSCFGKVLSDQDQGQGRRRKVPTTPTPDVSSESSSVAASSWEAAGLWASVVGLSLTCCGQRREPALLSEGEPTSSSGASPSATNCKTTPSVADLGETVMAAPTPGLGGMKRFASGRRTASWSGGLDLEAADGTRSGPPSPQRRGEGILPGRRSVGSLEDLDCDREWESEGAASV